MDETVSLYIHFPFCVRKCLYCAFNSTADSGVDPGEYAGGLLREMELRAELLSRPLRAVTLYFGGGTPSLMAPTLVGGIVDAAVRLFRLDGDVEVTLEANPGTVDEARLAGYRAAGVNRLSLGVQSFDDRMLELLGRLHSAREAREAFAAARRAGFENIGVDLIHSLPGEDLSFWREELRQAVSLGPDHISAYGLTVEEGTPFARLEEEGGLDLPEEEVAARMFEETGELLAVAGFEQYEISNFARSGRRSRHNQAYWWRGNCLGFGAGAHGFLRTPGFGERWKNLDDSAAYLRAMGEGGMPEEWRSPLTQREAMAEWLFLGLRMLDGVETARFGEEFGFPLDAVYGAEIRSLAAAGLLESAGGRLRLSRRGIILSNRVFAAFL